MTSQGMPQGAFYVIEQPTLPHGAFDQRFVSLFWASTYLAQLPAIQSKFSDS